MLELLKNYYITKDTNWQSFSLEEKWIEKDKPEYFTDLLKRFNLIPEEVIYFDNNEENIKSAQKVGILSKHYTDVNSIKKFITDNLSVFIPLIQKNVDTGIGVERTLALLNNLKDNYLTGCFLQIIKEIEKISEKNMEKTRKLQKRWE